MPGKKLAFTRASILFRPHWIAGPHAENGGGAGHRPRVRNGYYTSRLSP